MSASTPSNDATPRTLAAAGLPRRVRKALEQALSLVTAELDGNLGNMLREFEQELFRLADLARHPGAESNYMQTLRTLRMNRADLIPRFMQELEAGVAAIRAAKPAVAEPEREERIPFHALSLVEDEVMDEDAVLREIATRQESRAALPLHLLGQRFGVLAGSPAFDAERIPLGPRALCRAMRGASQTLQVPYEARLLLYRIFDRLVMASYARALEKLDEAMDIGGVLPGLTFVPVRARTSPRHAPGDRGQHTQRGSATRHGAVRPAARESNAGHGAGHDGDRHASASPVPGRRDGRAASPQLRPHTAWMGESWDDVHGDDEQASLDMLQQLMSGRRALIGKLRPNRPAGLREELSTADVFRALGVLQAQATASTGGNRSLHDIRQTLLAQARQRHGKGAALSQRDSDTFELLSMLYGQIEEEIRADAPGAALVRRLQLPLLRVALQDRAFFVRGHHPARRLLNTVAESAARWLDQDDYDPQMLLPLQQAVTHVIENYDGDDAVFETSNTRLEKHLQEQVRKAELLERRHVEAARGKEKLEVAKLRAGETLQSIIGERRLPRFVHALLNQAWADVLTLTLLRQGEGSDDWRRQVQATQEIVTACGSDDAPADPALTTHVAEALAQVGYHADEAEVIAQRLTRRVPEGEDDPASRTELAVKLKARARLGEDPEKARRPKPPPRTPEEQARYEQLRVMPFGTWIEFTTNQQGDFVRRRLSWFSPVTDNALFVNQRGQRVGEHSLDSLARMITAGQARIVTAERGRLVDRAWQAAISALRSFAGRDESIPLVEPK